MEEIMASEAHPIQSQIMKSASRNRKIGNWEVAENGPRAFGTVPSPPREFAMHR